MKDAALQLRELQQNVDAFDDTVAAHLGLNRTDLRCLDVVLLHEPLPAGELAAATNLSPAATTTAIDRLERADYAVRTRDPGNRRRVLVESTPAGRAAERRMYGPVAQAGAAVLGAYTGEQLELIRGFLASANRMQLDQIARVRTSTPDRTDG